MPGNLSEAILNGTKLLPSHPHFCNSFLIKAEILFSHLQIFHLPVLTIGKFPSALYTLKYFHLICLTTTALLLSSSYQSFSEELKKISQWLYQLVDSHDSIQWPKVKLNKTQTLLSCIFLGQVECDYFSFLHADTTAREDIVSFIVRKMKAFIIVNRRYPFS